jgi:hypothetical protein
MNTPPPILSLIFAIICIPLLIIRNIYYFQLWQNRDRIKDENQIAVIFPKGFRKFFLPIMDAKKNMDTLILSRLKLVNLLSYLYFLSFIVALLTFFVSILKT